MRNCVVAADPVKADFFRAGSPAMTAEKFWEFSQNPHKLGTTSRDIAAASRRRPQFNSDSRLHHARTLLDQACSMATADPLAFRRLIW